LVKKHILKNGLRLVYEKNDYIRSVSLGIWVNVGSSHENSTNNGLSHFNEHMFFKGTETMNAKEIADRVDNIGGLLNAFTNKEMTCYYMRVIDENLTESLDIMTEMFLKSKYDEKDIENEKNVIIEEIKMYDDSPEDIVSDRISELVFKGSALELPILGKKEDIQGYTREDILKFRNDKYTAENIVITVVGNFDEKELINYIEENYSDIEKGKTDNVILNVPYKREIVSVHKEIEQMHFCLSNRSWERGHKLNLPLKVFNNTFGGSMSSKLFQELREKRGLVYSTTSYFSSYIDTGSFGIYAGLAYDKLDECLKVITEIMDDLAENGLLEEEIERSKRQLKCNYILALESSSNVMSFIGRQEMLENKTKTVEEVIKEIEAINKDDIDEICKALMKKEEMSAIFVGNETSHDKNIELFNKYLK